MSGERNLSLENSEGAMVSDAGIEIFSPLHRFDSIFVLRLPIIIYELSLISRDEFKTRVCGLPSMDSVIVKLFIFVFL